MDDKLNSSARPELVEGRTENKQHSSWLPRSGGFRTSGQLRDTNYTVFDTESY
jgi:hypothetical protein